METINAFKCDYCNKVYQIKGSCKTHEKKCYHNPANRSCACCEFLIKETHKIDEFNSTERLVCLSSNDVSTRLRTGCSNWVENDSLTFEELDNVFMKYSERNKANLSLECDKNEGFETPIKIIPFPNCPF